MKRVAVYPGSFDPIHFGHIDIIERVSRLYDEVIVLIAESNAKAGLLPVRQRVELAAQCLAHLKNVKVDHHKGLTVEYVQKQGAQVIVRGLRAVVDFEYELSMGNINHRIAPQIETILIFARPEFYFVSSRAVKELMVSGGNPDPFVPAVVQSALAEALKNSKGFQ